MASQQTRISELGRLGDTVGAPRALLDDITAITEYKPCSSALWGWGPSSVSHGSQKVAALPQKDVFWSDDGLCGTPLHLKCPFSDVGGLRQASGRWHLTLM